MLSLISVLLYTFTFCISVIWFCTGFLYLILVDRIAVKLLPFLHYGFYIMIISIIIGLIALFIEVYIDNKCHIKVNYIDDELRVLENRYDMLNRALDKHLSALSTCEYKSWWQDRRDMLGREINIVAIRINELRDTKNYE